MAQLFGRNGTIVEGDTADVHTVQAHPVGTRAFDTAGNEYIYLAGVVSTAANNWVTYDEAGATTRIAANAVGPVAIAQAATVADTYGWYGIFGEFLASTDTVAADVALYIDATAGRADDAAVTGDLIVGAMTRSADTSNVATVQISYPFVTNILG